MCELKVLKNDDVVFESAIYAKVEGDKVTVRNVLGITQVFDNCSIAEIDITKERLLLSPTDK